MRQREKTCLIMEKLRHNKSKRTATKHVYKQIWTIQGSLGKFSVTYQCTCVANVLIFDCFLYCKENLIDLIRLDKRIDEKHWNYAITNETLHESYLIRCEIKLFSKVRCSKIAFDKIPIFYIFKDIFSEWIVRTASGSA